MATAATSEPDAPVRGESRFTGPAMLLVSVLFVADQARFTLSYARHWVNGDSTIMWLAARDLGHFRWYQPTFYGEAYNTMLDAAPAELLRRMGLSLPNAMALTAVALGAGGYVLLAAAAWRRRHRLLAIAALAMPLLVTFRFTISSEKPSGAGLGFLCAFAATAAVVANPTRRRNLVAFSVLAGLAFAWDFGVVYLVAPVAVYALCRNRDQLVTLVWALVGFVPGIALVAYIHVFFKDHPDYDLHKSEGYRPSIENLKHSLPHPARYFTLPAPEFLRWWEIPVLIGVALLVAALVTRRWIVVLTAFTPAVLVFATLAMPKALDGTASAYLDFGRYFVVLPAATWFVVFALAEEHDVAGRWVRWREPALIALVVLAVVAGAVRAVTFTARLDAINAYASNPLSGAPVLPTARVVNDCRDVTELVQRTQIDFVVYLEDFTGIYGCQALSYGKLTTFFPLYDRRTWLVHDEATRNRDAFLASDADKAWCDRAMQSPLVTSCTLDADVPWVAVVHTKPAPAISVLRSIGVKIRPFTQPH